MKNVGSYGGKTAYHSDVATNYERDRSREPVWAAEQLWVESWIETLPTGATLLDLPAGTGRFTSALLKRGLNVHAMDISEEMLKQVKERHGAYSGRRLSVSIGDAENIDLANDSIDYVLSWRLVHLLPAATLPKVFGEFARVARREVVVHVFSVRTGDRSISIWDSLKDRARPLMHRLRNRKCDLPWGHIESFCHHESTLQRAWESAGLHLNSAVTISHYLDLPVRVYRLSPIRE